MNTTDDTTRDHGPAGHPSPDQQRLTVAHDLAIAAGAAAESARKLADAALLRSTIALWLSVIATLAAVLYLWR